MDPLCLFIGLSIIIVRRNGNNFTRMKLLHVYIVAANDSWNNIDNIVVTNAATMAMNAVKYVLL